MATLTVGFMKPNEVVKIELVAGGGELADHALGVGAFGDVLDEGGLTLSPKCRLDLLAAESWR